MHQDPELNALEECFNLLGSLTPAARSRVLYWLNSRFIKEEHVVDNHTSSDTDESIDIITDETSTVKKSVVQLNGRNATTNNSTSQGKIKVKTLEELTRYISGVTESEKALLMATYLQSIQHQNELTGRMINDYLKKYDEGVKNITSALRVLIQKQPALIKQTFKSGNQAQSQKKYQVTDAGFNYANSIIKHKSI